MNSQTVQQAHIMYPTVARCAVRLGRLRVTTEAGDVPWWLTLLCWKCFHTDASAQCDEECIFYCLKVLGVDCSTMNHGLCGISVPRGNTSNDLLRRVMACRSWFRGLVVWDAGKLGVGSVR